LHLRTIGSTFSIMAHRIPTTRHPRKDTLYTQGEIDVLGKHKVEYMDQTTRVLRAHVLRNKILVDLFNYWDAQGTLPSEEAACVRRVKVNDEISEI
jgi:hypothetical protein